MLVLLAYLFVLAIYTANAASDTTDFDWGTVEPSTSLNYTTCYGSHKCAKLVVPLDWLEPANNPARVTLAIIARPAVVAETDPSFGGSIIVNPGGPSGSGVAFLRSAGELIQRTADGKKKYEILSFDPRGVGYTTPNSDCYQDEFARGASTLEDRAMGPLDAGIDIVKRKFALADAFGRLCAEGATSNNIRGFMSTSSVARDMVEIVDKLDELRKGDVAGSARTSEGREQQRLELRSVENIPRIQYWGFSYGTVLGNYFASMFPGRVGRIILEAVEDVHDYYNATWALNLPDTEKVLLHLWDTCYEAGDKCPLYKATDRGPKDVQNRVEAFIEKLDTAPEPYLSQRTIISITKQDVYDTIFRPLYQPQRDFPRLATTLAEAMAGNFTKLYEGLGSPKRDESCPLRIPAAYTWSQDAQNAIACGDGEPQGGLTIPDFLDHLDRLKSDSPEFGASWSGIRLACKGWRVRPKYRFSGPWVTPKADPDLVEGKPAAPLLFISSRWDPVTPLANAYEASKAHPGSAVLIQENAGHGSLRSPGKCREDFIKKYFETGELPPKDTVCAPDCKPFQECHQMDMAALAQDTEQDRRSRRPPLGLI